MIDIVRSFRPYIDKPPAPAPAPPRDPADAPLIDAEIGVELGNEDLPVDLGVGVKARIGGKEDAHTPDPPTLLSRPVRIPANYSAATPALTYCYLAFQPPTRNVLWEVLRVSVSPPDGFASLAPVSVIAFLSEQVPADSNAEIPGFPDMLGPAGVVPNVMSPSRRELVIGAPTRLILCLKGLPNGQSINASMYVIEHDARSFLAAMKG